MILRAPANKSFVTGDSPVTLLSMDRPQQLLGFGVPGVARVMPISSEVCLASYSPGSGMVNATADRDQVRQINLAIAGQAQEFILGKSPELIASLVEATCAKQWTWVLSF